ncbi:unnamed protein product [Chrysoparadoxa australica]
MDALQREDHPPNKRSSWRRSPPTSKTPKAPLLQHLVPQSVGGLKNIDMPAAVRRLGSSSALAIKKAFRPRSHSQPDGVSPRTFNPNMTISGPIMKGAGDSGSLRGMFKGQRSQSVPEHSFDGNATMSGPIMMPSSPPRPIRPFPGAMSGSSSKPVIPNRSPPGMPPLPAKSPPCATKGAATAGPHAKGPAEAAAEQPKQQGEACKTGPRSPPKGPASASAALPRDQPVAVEQDRKEPPPLPSREPRAPVTDGKGEIEGTAVAKEARLTCDQAGWLQLGSGSFMNVDDGSEEELGPGRDAWGRLGCKGECSDGEKQGVEVDYGSEVSVEKDEEGAIAAWGVADDEVCSVEEEPHHDEDDGGCRGAGGVAAMPPLRREGSRVMLSGDAVTIRELQEQLRNARSRASISIEEDHEGLAAEAVQEDNALEQLPEPPKRMAHLSSDEAVSAGRTWPESSLQRLNRPAAAAVAAGTAYKSVTSPRVREHPMIVIARLRKQIGTSRPKSMQL